MTASVEDVRASGPVITGASGATVSTTQVSLSTTWLPRPALATTAKVCVPSASEFTDSGLVHVAWSTPSRRQVSVLWPVAVKANVPVVALVTAAGRPLGSLHASAMGGGFRTFQV